MTNRQSAALKTKQKIVEAGKKLIAEKGFDNVSVEDITRASGVAKGTFYTYFKRKEDIVFELSRNMFGEILEHAKAFKGSFLEKLELYRLARPLAFTMLTKSLYKLYRLLGSLLVEDIAAARLVYVFTELLVLPSYTITYDTLTRAYSV